MCFLIQLSNIDDRFHLFPDQRPTYISRVNRRDPTVNVARDARRRYKTPMKRKRNAKQKIVSRRASLQLMKPSRPGRLSGHKERRLIVNRQSRHQSCRQRRRGPGACRSPDVSARERRSIRLLPSLGASCALGTNHSLLDKDVCEAAGRS